MSAVKKQRGYKNNLENNGNVTIVTTEHEHQRGKKTRIIERMLKHNEHTIQMEIEENGTKELNRTKVTFV